MTTTSSNFGRLCNQIIRNIAVSLVAEKFDLWVYYSSQDIINRLGIPLFCGTKMYETTQPLTENNYFSVYHSEKVEYNLDPNNSFFQTTEAIRLIYQYIQQNSIKSNIIKQNPFKDRYHSNNDIFIHIRLGDVKQYSPGLNYYINTIKCVNFDKLYFSTDEKEHDIITQICSLYPESQIIEYDELNTIQFASTCKHVILSHGSFSAVIGYVSFFSDIYYPEHTSGKIWYGDLNCIKYWKKCPV
jgi:hypothetical protein